MPLDRGMHRPRQIWELRLQWESIRVIETTQGAEAPYLTSPGLTGENPLNLPNIRGLLSSAVADPAFP